VVNRLLGPFFGWVVLSSVGCAGTMLGAPRGELVLGARLTGMQLKSVELQHQAREHTVSITGFELGQDIVRRELPAGPYCVERLVFDMGPVGGVVSSDMCFEVSAEGTTYLGTLSVREGRLVLVRDGERLEQALAREERAADPGASSELE
jgi:hypothetical protein